jgi:hypothetical protein
MEPNVFMSFAPLFVLSVSIGIVARLLAHEKGRNVTKWTLLGLIPIVNFFSVWFFVGAANLRLERKVDELLAMRRT